MVLLTSDPHGSPSHSPRCISRFSDTSAVHVFEGDMLLTEEQIQAAENGMDPNNVGGARGLYKRRRWPGGIVPYTLHESAGKQYIFSSINIFDELP